MTEPGGGGDLSDIEAAFADIVSDNPLVRGAVMDYDDIGNARRVVLYEGRDLKYVTAVGGGYWYRWTGTHWREVFAGEMLQIAIDVHDRLRDERQFVPDARLQEHDRWVSKSRTHVAINATINIAAGLREMWVPLTDLDRDPYLINTGNCVVDLRDCSTRDVVREDWITKRCPTPYDPNARSELLTRFFEQFLPDKDERNYVLTALATAVLLGGNPSRTMLMLMGPTSTGKSTLIDLLVSTLGSDYVSTVNASVFRSNLSDSPRPDLLKALRSRLIIAHEASDNWELHGDQIKRMTGQDPMTARGMHSNVMIEQVAGFTPLIVANEAPRIKGADDALRRRLRVVLMDQAVAMDVDDGRQRWQLVNDADARMAFLALLVRMFSESNGTLPAAMPIRFAEYTQRVFTEFDDVKMVLDSLLSDGSMIHMPNASPAQCMTMTDLYRLYSQRSRALAGGGTVGQTGTLSARAFWSRLKSLGIETWRSNGTRVKGYVRGTFAWTDLGM